LDNSPERDWDRRMTRYPVPQAVCSVSGNLGTERGTVKLSEGFGKQVRANRRESFGTFDPVPAKVWASVQQYTRGNAGLT
jgi:hypothetical protein